MLITAAGCAVSGNTAPAVTSSMAGASRVPLPTLEAGRRLFLTRCTACHTADPVAKYPLARWKEIVADMTGRAKLSVPDRAALLAYITAAPATLPAP